MSASPSAPDVSTFLDTLSFTSTDLESAKAAVHGLTRSLARELGKHRIRVNTVVPGWIMTERQKSLWLTPETLERQLDRQCLPIPIEPVFVANMIVFLASDAAAMCTANHYVVDAGSS